MTKAQRKRTRNRARKPIIYPIGLEKSYFRSIQNITSVFIDRCSPLVNKYVDAYFIRQDSVEDDLDVLMDDLMKELELIYGVNALSSGQLGKVLADIAERILGANSAYFQKQITVLSGGVPLAMEKPWWPEAKALWEKQNYKLIKNLGEEYITKINNTIINGLQNGWGKEQIIEAISKIDASLSGHRSYVIARDQVGKLNSIITREQSMYIGMETYFWTSARDERVRGDPSGPYKKAIPSHYDMEGLLCTWRNSEVYSDDLGVTWKKKTGKMEPLQAGMAIMCRCVCSPSWNQYTASIDRTLGDNI
jgi:hypothetical protein